MVENVNDVTHPGSSPQRVVSLAPSITDSMLALGLGRFLVGATDRCVLPDSLTGVVRVGTAESIRISEIIDLRPDLVIAGGGEKATHQVGELRQAGLALWVTDPRTVRQAVADLRDLAIVYASESALQSIVWLDRAVDWLAGSPPEKTVRVFLPTGRDGPEDVPASWKTFSAGTYAGDLLALCGAENIFEEKVDESPFKVTPQEVMQAAPELILLPGDPFPFSDADAAVIRAALPDVPAVKSGRIFLVDGKLLFWPGARLGRALQVLPDLVRCPERREVP
jgi:ABC-type Fe3+-hydroxamate transport system substrate-binding protein